jgi:hypothetical protein
MRANLPALPLPQLEGRRRLFQQGSRRRLDDVQLTVVEPDDQPGCRL